MWCHNPETQNTKPEMMFYEQNCVSCGKCVKACSTSLGDTTDNKIKRFDRNYCDISGACADSCLHGALELIGRDIDSDEIVDIALKDLKYYKNSGGGLTISGGEALLQKEWVKDIFTKTKEKGIHNALDTALNVKWDEVKDIFQVTDLVLLDLKCMDDTVHQYYTGVSNEQILDNAQKLSREDVDIIVRIPVIMGVNDTHANMSATATFLNSFRRLKQVELLPYHSFGMEKSRYLGKESRVFETPTNERMTALKDCFTKKNIKAIIV
jgi:pyruvate formate lyase activating enzyme